MNKEEPWVLLTACVAVWLLLGQNVFLLVALGAGYRLFTKDVPQQPSWAITACFVALVVSLGLLMWSLPAENFGTR